MLLRLFIFIILIINIFAFDFGGLYNFNPPYDTDHQDSVKSWITGGSTEIHTKGVALTTGTQQKGMLWHPVPVTMSSWQVSFKFSVHGTHEEGDHGLAFWYTETAGIDGPVFGNQDYFKGLGVLFDSKDDDGNHNNPSVAAHLYDGTIPFHHDDDGISDQLAGCVADYRNRPEPVTARITYKRGPKTLEVYLDMVNKGRFQRCLMVDDVEMPKEFYFGLTADTIDKDDVHMIHSFSVTDLSSGQGEDAADTPAKPHELGAHSALHPDSHVSGVTYHRDPAHKLKQQINSASSHTTTPPPPPDHPAPPTSSHHDATVRHTNYLVDHVQRVIDDSKQEHKDNLNVHVAGLHQKVDHALSGATNELLTEIRGQTQTVQEHTSAELETRIANLLHDLKREVDSGLEVYSRHTNEVIESQSTRISQLSQQLIESKAGFERVTQELKTIVNSLNSKTKGAHTISHQNHEVRNLRRHVDQIHKELQDTISSHGIGWGTTIMMILPLLGSIATLIMLRGSNNRSQYGKIV